MSKRILDFLDAFTSDTQPTVGSIAGDFSIGITNKFYIGDETTDGSWRVYVASGNLVFEKRILGTWTLKENIPG